MIIFRMIKFIALKAASIIGLEFNYLLEFRKFLLQAKGKYYLHIKYMATYID